MLFIQQTCDKVTPFIKKYTLSSYFAHKFSDNSYFDGKSIFPFK
ncbi:hypothetical protein EUBHAL_02874 [Anaerobutyricum hallii DSM 3353]|uniref:Uncharacterized protein n=1 Tax=Anaerobutyricum hallii DSM 3353 TaxID=411469 RepID=C0EZL3_9FIRM|nr:hypothetical protein EUBHAL_02874 [Anaerobutyricum hallii DSM 3353]